MERAWKTIPEQRRAGKTKIMMSEIKFSNYRVIITRIAKFFLSYFFFFTAFASAQYCEAVEHFPGYKSMKVIGNG